MSAADNKAVEALGGLDAAERKRQAACVERGAVRGFQVKPMADGSYLISRNGLMASPIKGLQSLEEWLVRAGC